MSGRERERVKTQRGNQISSIAPLKSIRCIYCVSVDTQRSAVFCIGKSSDVHVLSLTSQLNELQNECPHEIFTFMSENAFSRLNFSCNFFVSRAKLRAFYKRGSKLNISCCITTFAFDVNLK